MSAFAFRPLPHVVDAAASFARTKHPALPGSMVWKSSTKTLALHVRSGDRYKNHAKAALVDSLNAHASGKDSVSTSFEAWFLATDDGDNLVEAEAFSAEYVQPFKGAVLFVASKRRRQGRSSKFRCSTQTNKLFVLCWVF